MQRPRYKSILLSALFAIMLGCSTGFAKTVNEADLKAEFIFRFLQYTTWPQPLEREFYLCIMGESKVADAVERFSGRLVQKAPFIAVRPYSTIIPEGCNAVFLTERNRAELRDTVGIYSSQSTLIIGDAPDAFAEEVDIALLTEPNRIGFSINKTRAEARRLQFSGQMLKLAEKIR